MTDSPRPQEAPRTRRGLRRFVRHELGFAIPDRAICPAHRAPLDYLTASFLDQHDLLVWANRGGGKTLLAALATVLDAMFHGPVAIRVLGGSFEQSDRLAEYIREVLEAHPHLLDGRMTRERIPLAGGSQVRVLAQSQRAVRGLHVQKIRCDEVDLFDADVWRAVQFATRSRDTVRGSIEVLSTLHRSGGLMDELVAQARAAGEESPPPARRGRGRPRKRPTPAGYRLISWCLWEVIERCPARRRCGECLLADDCNPNWRRDGEKAGLARRGRGFFPIDDAITIKARSSRSAWESEMLCRGASREWLVFGEFDPARHIRAVPTCPDWPTYRAIDFGYRSPLVCLWMQVTPGGRVHVVGEYVRARLPLATHAQAILERDPAPVTMTYVDPAGRQRESTSGAACTEILSAAGIPCAWRGSSIAEGLELIRAALAPAAGERDADGRIEPTLAVHPRCRKLIHAFGSYHYPAPGRPGSPETPVKDGPDHLIDALRYFFVNRMRPRSAARRGRY